MEQAMSDDSRLGMVKNQQWIRTNETSKVLVSNYGTVDYQKVEQYPPEVYTSQPFPEKTEPLCPCFDIPKVVNFSTWSGTWDDSEIFLDFSMIISGDDGEIHTITMYRWLDNFATQDILLKSGYPCNIEYRTDAINGTIVQDMSVNIGCVFTATPYFMALDPRPDIYDSPLWVYCDGLLLTRVTVYF
jgi:hypothetical protein